MKKILKIVLGCFFILVLCLALLPLFISVNSFKPQIVAAFNEHAKGQARIDGDISLRILPTLAISVTDIGIANPAWAGGGEMLRIPKISLGMELMPLLHKEFRVTSIELDSPTILIVKKGARSNWQNEEKKTKPSSAATSDTKSPPIEIQHFYIGNANLTYKDLDSNTTHTVRELSIKLAAPKPELAAKIDIKGLYNNEKFSFESGIGTPIALMNGKNSTVEASVSYGNINGIYKGELTLGAVPYLKGKITSKSLIFNAHKKNLGGNESGASGSSGWSTEPIDFSVLKSANAQLSIQIDSLTFGKTTIAPFATDVVLKNGLLNFKAKDINVYGGTVSILGNLAGSATDAMVSVTKSGPYADLTLSLAGVKAEPLLSDWMNNDSLEGTLNGNLRVMTVGNSQREMISTLSGDGAFKVTDGAIKGKNLAAAIRSLKSLGGKSEETDAKQTDFSELTGTFKIAQGVIRNNDLYMKSPLIRLKGVGEIVLPPMEINYVLKPEVVATLKGQGGRDDHAGLTVPILVKGPIKNPNISLDMKSAITDNLTPDKIEKTIENVKDLKKVDKKQAIEGLKGLLGR
jgi:AsmA protein